MCYVREYVRLAGLTDNRNVRDQLITLARDWLSATLRKRCTDAEARADLYVKAATELSVATSVTRFLFYDLNAAFS